MFWAKSWIKPIFGVNIGFIPIPIAAHEVGHIIKTGERRAIIVTSGVVADFSFNLDLRPIWVLAQARISDTRLCWSRLLKYDFIVDYVSHSDVSHGALCLLKIVEGTMYNARACTTGNVGMYDGLLE